MPATCSVHGCKSRSRLNNNTIKYYKFPKDEVRRMMWLKAINREDFVPTNSSMVCNAHFTNADYQYRPNLVKLTNNAVPSVFNDLGFTQKSAKQKNRVKPVRKYCNRLSDHTYSLKIREENQELPTSIEIKSEKFDSSICMVQTIKVEDDIDEKPCVTDLQMNNLTSEDIKPITKDMTNPSNNTLLVNEHEYQELLKSERKWKETTLEKCNIIEQLRKKVKNLQQTNRRYSTKIKNLRVLLNKLNDAVEDL